MSMQIAYSLSMLALSVSAAPALTSARDRIHSDRRRLLSKRLEPGYTFPSWLVVLLIILGIIFFAWLFRMCYLLWTAHQAGGRLDRAMPQYSRAAEEVVARRAVTATVRETTTSAREEGAVADALNQPDEAAVRELARRMLAAMNSSGEGETHELSTLPPYVQQAASAAMVELNASREARELRTDRDAIVLANEEPTEQEGSARLCLSPPMEKMGTSQIKE